MQAKIDDKSYRVEFSYRRFPTPLPLVNGVSACAIVGEKLIALGQSVCSVSDDWSRRTGRKRAFERAVLSCGALRANQLAWFSWFLERFPEPRARPTPPKWPLPPDEIERRKTDGRAMKAMRKAAPAGETIL